MTPLIKRIVLAEDDPKDVELTMTALGEQNLDDDVVALHDGAEVLAYLRREGPYKVRPSGHPVVILLDLKMPKLNGIDVIKVMKSDAELKKIPIVVLTSSKESRDLDECYKLGVNAYVVKPVKFEDFLAAIKRLGVFWALVNEPPPGSVGKAR